MPSNVKVLLVDDNPMIQEMLRRELAALAPVQTANDGADALLKAVDDLPDLIICDYDMPGMNGRQLLEKLKSRATTAKVPVILMANKEDISEKLKVLQDTVEDLVEKPFFVKETVAHIKKTIDKIALEKMAREAPGESTVRGNLAQMSCMDLLQSLEMGRKSCSLLLGRNGEQCEMYFTEGQINHAVYGNLRGDEAVYKVLTWNGGNFQINFNATSPEQTCTRSTQGLLMEGLRLLDESNRDSEANVGA
jgi:DNA-binding response OmpR family regulator